MGHAAVEEVEQNPNLPSSLLFPGLSLMVSKVSHFENSTTHGDWGMEYVQSQNLERLELRLEAPRGGGGPEKERAEPLRVESVARTGQVRVCDTT